MKEKFDDANFYGDEEENDVADKIQNIENYIIDLSEKLDTMHTTLNVLFAVVFIGGLWLLRHWDLI